MHGAEHFEASQTGSRCIVVALSVPSVVYNPPKEQEGSVEDSRQWRNV